MRRRPSALLFYEGRRQDFAFEKAIGGSADRRHHVRLWLVLAKGDEGRSVWLGAATRDLGVGLSHYTGQITHHIAADIDAERDALLADLTASRMVTALYKVSGVGPTLFGRNGEGDNYFTDGELRFAVISPGGTLVSANPVELESPALSELKDNLWSAARSLGPGRAVLAFFHRPFMFDLRGVAEHGGGGAIFFLGELDGALDRGGLQVLALQAVNHLHMGENFRLFRGALAVKFNLAGRYFLAALLEDHHHVKGGAGAQVQ